jgi:hypothetical protein
MSQKTIGKFLLEYKRFVNDFDMASSRKDLVRVLVHSSGMSILPSILFTTAGALKSFDRLHVITEQHLDFFIKKNTFNSAISMLLLVNIQTTNQKLRQWDLPLDTINPKDFIWFESRYKVKPTSARIVRSVLIKHEIHDLRFYLTKDCDLRVDMRQILSQLRFHLS